MVERKRQELGRELEVRQETAVPDLEAIEDDVGDDLLGLMFVSCHPVLSKEARIALTLRLLGGLSTEEIARAFLVPEPTAAQRIVRAKRTLAEARVPFEVPQGSDREARLSSVLRSSTSSSTRATRRRPATTGCGRRCARTRYVWAASSPGWRRTNRRSTAWSPSWRSRPRGCGCGRGPGASPCCCSIRTARWDQLLIRRGLAALERAERLGGALGPYALQAAIAACHARARTAAETDWPRIAALYDALAQIAPSPVVDLNRAVARLAR